jgi:hypothetical protein
MHMEFPPPGQNPHDLPPPAEAVSPPADLPGLTPDTRTGVVDITRPSDQTLPGVLESSVERPDLTRPTAAANEPQEGNREVAASDATNPEPVGMTDGDPDLTGPGETPPPDVPGAGETGAGEPDRGRALRNLVDFASRSKEALQQAAAAVVEAHPTAGGLVTEKMVEEGIPYEAAVQEVIHEIPEDGESLHRQVTASAIEKATREHAADLEAAGMFIYTGTEDDLSLRINDIPSFTAALEQIDIPDTQEAQGELAGHLDQAVRLTISTGSYGILLRNPGVPDEIFDGDTPYETDYTRIVEDFGPIDDKTAKSTDDLAAHSGAMGQALSRIGATHLALYATQHATAISEGLGPEWAVADSLRLIGNDPWRMGVSRYDTTEEWQDAFTYLEHMRNVAPDAELTRLIVDNVINDLTTALEEPDLSIIYSGNPHADEVAYEYRSQLSDEARPMLYEALIRVQQMFGRRS